MCVPARAHGKEKEREREMIFLQSLFKIAKLRLLFMITHHLRLSLFDF